MFGKAEVNCFFRKGRSRHDRVKSHTWDHLHQALGTEGSALGLCHSNSESGLFPFNQHACLCLCPGMVFVTGRYPILFSSICHEVSRGAFPSGPSRDSRLGSPATPQGWVTQSPGWPTAQALGSDPLAPLSLPPLPSRLGHSVMHGAGQVQADASSLWWWFSRRPHLGGSVCQPDQCKA